MDVGKTNYLWQKREKGILVAAHRGTCGGNIIQNTCLSYENALLHGADMIEVDVVKSIDGVFYAFHNGVEKTVWGLDRDIFRMSFTEIERYPCKNELDIYVDQKVERLETILERFKGRCLINIDRSWFFWKEILEFLDQYQMYDQIVLKSPAEPEYLELLEQTGSPVMYMPIIRTKEGWELAERYQVNTVAVEVIFEHLEDDVVQPEFLADIHKKGILLWVNALTLNDDITLSALLDDNRAIMNGFDTAWGKLLEMGFDIIQTDWPALLKPYAARWNP